MCSTNTITFTVELNTAYIYLCQARYAIMSVCLSFVVSVILSACLCGGLVQQDSANVIEICGYNWAYQRYELINFWR